LYAAIPEILPLFNACLAGLFGSCLQLPCHILLFLRDALKSFPLQGALQPGEEEEVAGGQISLIRRVGSHGDAVLGQEFPDTQGRVAWRIVVVQKPGTGRPFLRPFPTNCISKALQNGYVDSLIHGLALGKKLVMHQTLLAKESDQHFLDF
jgi:hypothetical protein